MSVIGILAASMAVGTSTRVPGFLPSASAFAFDNNHWPKVPNYRIAMLGRELQLGSASDGLCGGMVFAVRDLFEAGVKPPTIQNPPDPGAPLFNYIIAALTRSFTFGNIKQFLDGIQTPDMTAGNSRGIGWNLVHEQWPLIKADIDSGLLAPVGLIHGRERSGVGYITGWQHLSGCHQVLAYGYDVVDTTVTLRIYDPNHLGDDQTISFDTAKPESGVNLRFSGYTDGQFRGLFRETYAFHDPRTPITCRFAGAQIVSSPGIASRD